MRFHSVCGGQKEVRSDQIVGLETWLARVHEDDKDYYVRAILRDGKIYDILGPFGTEKEAKDRMRDLAAELTGELKA
jgi:hypothetical protein